MKLILFLDGLKDREGWSYTQKLCVFQPFFQVLTISKTLKKKLRVL